jgi:hypothetical protein
MNNHEHLFEKIEAKEKEWDAQVKHLRSKAVSFDSETRIKIEQQLDNLNVKLEAIKKRTSELKKTSSEAQQDLGDKIVHSWIELFTKIDKAMLKLKK